MYSRKLALMVGVAAVGVAIAAATSYRKPAARGGSPTGFGVVDGAHMRTMLERHAAGAPLPHTGDRPAFLAALRIHCMKRCKHRPDGPARDRAYASCVSQFDWDCSDCMRRWSGNGVPQCVFWGHTANKYGDMPDGDEAARERAGRGED